MSSVLHPFRSIRKWRERRQLECKVYTDNPPMKIKGRPYPKQATDSNFPTYIAFFGIPYAIPPTGRLRFQPPKPLKWTTRRTIKAYETDHTALQFGTNPWEFYGSEDCLYMNIYMAKKPEEMSKGLPVLVFIHGGGFEHGTGDIVHIEPDAIVRQNLIFVTINYRLNIFGFFNASTENCKGNAGLKDQVMALRWIRANIDRFGGDPYNVTITGHSSGATCVNLHTISPLSKGLFQKAIVMGGGLHCPWGYQGVQDTPRRLFAKELDMENELRFVLVETLIDGNAAVLLEITKNLVKNAIKLVPKKLMIFCGPSLEAFKKDAFIPCDVKDMLETAEPVSLIAGICEQEGYMYLLTKWQRYQDGFDRLVKNDMEFCEFLMQNFRWNQETAFKLQDTLREKYFPNLSRSTKREIRDQLATFNTDIWFHRFYDQFKIGGGNTPFYVYNFAYVAPKDRIRVVDRTGKLRLAAPTHGDEVHYLYNPSYLRQVGKRQHIPPRMQHVIDHMCDLWGSFCRNEVLKSKVEPNVEWRPHTEDQPCYLNIGESSTLVQSRLNETRWRELREIVDAESTVTTPAITPDTSFDYMNLESWGLQRRSLVGFK